MKIIDAFPLYSSSHNTEKSTFWSDSLNGKSLGDFVSFVEDHFCELSVISADEFHLISKSLLIETISAKQNASADEMEVLNFLQFFFCEVSADYLAHQGLFTNVHDWLVWSVSDQINYGSEVSFQLARIDSFFKSKIEFVKSNSSESYIRWMTTLFYYSRHQGGLKELSKMILDIEFLRICNLPKVIGLDFDQSTSLNLLCQALGWSINNKVVKGYKIAEVIKNWIPSLEVNNKKTACIQLATGGAQFTDERADYYAKEVIEKYSKYCHGHELLHAQSIYYTYNLTELEADFDQISSSFEMYTSSLVELSADSKKYEKGRIFGIIRGLIMTCLRRNKAKLAFRLLSEFYEKDGIYNDHLFIALNIDKQICTYVLHENFVTSEELSIDQYREMIEASNKFLSMKIALHDDPDFHLEEPKHLGFPIKGHGIQFEEKISRYYGFNKLIETKIGAFKSLVILPGLQHPIQSLMFKELGYSAPINSSFQISDSFRSVQRVLLWCYGTLTSDKELEFISKVFDKSNVNVEAINILEETKGSFLEKFNDPRYDIVWIATHGNYNHLLPHKSTLSILPEVEITVEELRINQKKFELQRLLFLNVCDGATSSTHDSLYEHGFGAGLANSNQCVLSHLWPVEADSALFFGILFAHNLSSFNFWDSYQNTITSLFQNGKGALEELIEEYGSINLGSLWEKLPNEINENIYYWGSGVYYN